MKKMFFVLSLLFALLQTGMPAQAQETYKFADRDTCSLYLDIWRPAQDAVRSIDGKEKPAVLFVFGGGFVMGSRNDPTQAFGISISMQKATRWWPSTIAWA